MGAIKQKEIQIIRADGTVEIFNKPLTLKNMQEAVGGLIEHVRVLDRINVVDEFIYTSMFVDDEGRLKEKPINIKATEIYRRNAFEQIKRGVPVSNFLLEDAFIVGDALYFQGYTVDEAERLYEGDK